VTRLHSAKLRIHQWAVFSGSVILLSDSAESGELPNWWQSRATHQGRVSHIVQSSIQSYQSATIINLSAELQKGPVQSNHIVRTSSDSLLMVELHRDQSCNFGDNHLAVYLTSPPSTIYQLVSAVQSLKVKNSRRVGHLKLKSWHSNTDSQQVELSIHIQ